MSSQFQEAIKLGLKKYNTGKPCKNGHFSDRYVRSSHCVECTLKRVTILRSSPKWESWKKSYDKKPNSKRLHDRRNERYRAENKSKIEQGKIAWRKRNPHAGRWYAATRRARILQATPVWIDQIAIKKIYETADRISRETGVPHEVDHFYPLVGRKSCGLHVPWNLRIITKAKNRRKHNREPCELSSGIPQTRRYG